MNTKIILNIYDHTIIDEHPQFYHFENNNVIERMRISKVNDH